MFSTCSELTPRAPIPDGRKAKFMQPCSYLTIPRPLSLCHISTWKMGRKPSFSNHPGIDVTKLERRFCFHIKAKLFSKRICKSFIKGRVAPPKQMNFRKSSKRPLTRPSFSENPVAICFSNFILKKPCLKVLNLQHKFLD